MKIVLFPSECLPFHGETIDERPLGGIETGVIRLAEALHGIGQEVYVVSAEAYIPETKPAYIRPGELDAIGEIDAVIVVRGVKALLLPFKAKKKFLWTGDSYESHFSLGIGDRRYANLIDALLLVSDWHAKTLCAASGFPLEKTFVLRNGVKLSLFENPVAKNRKRLIYSSTPFRGLKYLLQIFPELKKKHPDLELHIFSSMDVYKHDWPPIAKKEHPLESVLDNFRTIPGCVVHGSLVQRLLAQEFMKSAILTYPCKFEETSCITAMEAQAAGCPVVSTDMAALPETVGDAGFLIDVFPKDPSYNKKFIEACDRLLTDDSLYRQLSARAKERAQSMDWKCRAQDLVAYLHERHGLA